MRHRLLVDRGRAAADAQLPGDQHHLGRRTADVPHDAQRLSRAHRVRRHERDRRGGPGDVPGVRPDSRQRLEVLPVLHDHERPALLVLGAVRPRAGADDRGRGPRGRWAGPRTGGPRACVRTAVPDGHGWLLGRDRGRRRAAPRVAAPSRARLAQAAGRLVQRREPLRVWEPLRGDGRGDGGRLVGCQRAAEAGARNRAMAARYAGYSYSQECWPPGTTTVSVTASGRAARRAAARRPRCADRHDPVVRPVDQQHRHADVAHGPCGAHRRDRVAPRAAGRPAW